MFQEPFNPHSLAYHSVTPLWTMFEPFELTVNHRQGKGSKWVETLNRIRNQTFTEDDIKVLRSRIIPKASLDKDVFHVMYTNKLVAEYNKKVLEQLDGEEYVFMAIKSSKNCSIHKDKGTISFPSRGQSFWNFMGESLPGSSSRLRPRIFSFPFYADKSLFHFLC